jgi:tRNA 2-selenouridine synthase
MERISIDRFLEIREQYPVIDVRSPGEHLQGRIPGAVNIPLMENEERAVVGTMYKQNGKQAAVLKGLEIAGPKLKEYIKTARRIPNEGTFIVHCWRGGMRSEFFSWLLEFYGFKVMVIKGGYKSFRRKMIDEFNCERSLMVLGGKTGCGKTKILHELRNKGEAVIDLEGIAHHKGSSYGGLGEEPQPTQEQFENELGLVLYSLQQKNPVWIENESRMIGNKVIPEGLWNQMLQAPVQQIDIPFEERLQNIVNDYGKFPIEDLIEATLRISKRMGPEQTKLAIAALQEGDVRTAFRFALNYYDKTYTDLINQRKGVVNRHSFEQQTPEMIAEALLKYRTS